MKRMWAYGAAVAVLSGSACSVVLDPDDYVGDGSEDGGTPPPPVPPPPISCEALSTEMPGWRGCSFAQQGPASFYVPLAFPDIALAVTSGGDVVRGFGAIATVEADGRPTIGTFDLDNIDISDGFDLRTISPMRDVGSIALRAYDENNLAINVIGRSTEDATVRAWVGRVSADNAFELNPIYTDAETSLRARAGISGGYMPSPASQLFPLRFVWRADEADGERVTSVDESGDIESFAGSTGDAPQEERVHLSDSAGPWVALSTPTDVWVWRTDADGSALAAIGNDERTGRAAIAVAATGCHYAVAYPQSGGIRIVPLECDDGCNALVPAGDEAFIATDGAPSSVALTTMPEGGYALAAAEARSGANPVVVVRLLANDFSVQTMLDPLTPADFDGLVGPRYLDVQVAAAQRGAGYHVLVAASHDSGTSGDQTPHWLAAFHGCDG